MDANTLMIIGIILTIVFGKPAYIALIKKQKTKIFFFQCQHLKLHDDLTKNIPGLTMTFHGKPVISSMFYLKGIFICSGQQDVLDNDVKKGITLTLGEKGQWHTAEIGAATHDLELRPLRF